ncbi:MAG: cupin domain-containing protein [Gemmatimonadaceae bacterium]|nr:cupin domain-containing protein [Acetobacteraceae bacterium]
MNTLPAWIAGTLALAVCQPANSQDVSLTRPVPVLRQSIEGMPTGKTQDISVFTASFKPGDRTVFHTHRHPVTVYVLEGAFTLEFDGLPTVVVKAGEAFVEPPNVKMTGYNRSATDPIRLLIFYVGETGTPFLDPIH